MSYAKQQTVVRIFEAPKSKHKAIKTYTVMWSSKSNRRDYTKINKNATGTLYNSIIQYP